MENSEIGMAIVVFSTIIGCVIWLWYGFVWSYRDKKGKGRLYGQEKNVYKYHLVFEGKVIYLSLTYDFARRSVEHRKDYPDATIKQVGGNVTREEGLKWVVKQNLSRTSNVRNVDTI